MPDWRPKGLTPAIFNRIKDRVTRELGGIPTEDISPASGQGQMSSGLWKKILERAKDFVELDKGFTGGESGGDLGKKKPVSEKLDLPTIRNRIAQAGRLNVLVLVRYNGVNRHCEPYSFRWKMNKKGKLVELLYMYCRLHNTIEAYKPEKIEALYITDIKFSPRWPIEVG